MSASSVAAIRGNWRADWSAASRGHAEAALCYLSFAAAVGLSRGAVLQLGQCIVLGAVAHAIANATGVWVKELPITPERIRKALAVAK